MQPKMRAVSILEPGGPEKLVLGEHETPSPKPGEIRIRVKAAGVNRLDVLQRMGNYPVPAGASELPGLEIAGTVDALGEGVSRWREGDRVCALMAGGGYAQYATVAESCALPIPADLSWEEAAALPEAIFTVWNNVFQRGGLASGETFLVHGGTSGIGMTAIQLAKAFGARVIATAGSTEKCDACLSWGADAAINYHDEDFVAAVKTKTNGLGADVILDMVGGAYTSRNIDAAAEDGRIVQIAFLKGPKAEVDLRQIMTRRLTLTGSTLRGRSVTFKASIAAEIEQKVWPLLANRRLTPHIYKVFALEDASSAHALMESSKHVGKIVLKVD